jgi:hypothetical protein
MLLVALGCGRLPGILDVSAKHSFVVFGTMERRALAELAGCMEGNLESAMSVYFYETG